MKSVILIPFVLILMGFVNIDRPHIKHNVIEILYLEKVGGEIIDDPTRVTGLVNKDESVNVLAEGTWEIPNKLGTGFALGVEFTNIPDNISSFDLTIKFPEMILPSGELKSTLSRTIDLGIHEGEYIWYFIYYFDFPYETNIGDWGFTISSEGHIFYAGTISVVDHKKLNQ